MSDVGTMVWKELREQYMRKGKPSRALVVGLVFTLLMGLAVPLVIVYLAGHAGPVAAGTLMRNLAPPMVFALGFQAFGITMALAVDSFLGERERHTLETLVASPLPTRAVLLGKFTAAAGTVLVQVVLASLLEWAVYLSAFGEPAMQYGVVPLCAPIIGLAVCAMVTFVAVMVSVRAATMKTGQQAMAYIFMPFYLLPGFSGLLAQTPFGRDVADFYGTVGPAVFFLIVAGAWALLDAALFAAALRVYRRDRLILRGR